MTLSEYPNLGYASVIGMVVIFIIMCFRPMIEKWRSSRKEMREYNKETEIERKLYLKNKYPLGTHRLWKHKAPRHRKVIKESYRDRKQNNEEFRNKWDQLLVGCLK